MVNVIFCAHGQLACAMLDSVRMVYGDVQASAVAFMPGDLQCGSPWNAAAGLAMKNPRLRVISGLSLPLALELVDNQQTLTADALCAHLTTIASQCCVVWRQPETIEEDF